MVRCFIQAPFWQTAAARRERVPSPTPLLPFPPCPGVVGAGAGGLASLIHTALAGPSGARAAQAAFSATLLSTAPLTAAAGVLYTAGSCLAEDFLGARDWRSCGAGGALAGAVTIGIKQRSLQSAFVGALAMGGAGALGQVAQALEGSTAGQPHRAAPRPVSMTGEQLAVSAANSRSFTSRLQ